MARIVLSSVNLQEGDGNLSYTATGGGKLNVKAVGDFNGKVISSNTVEIIDCLFYDTGITGGNTHYYNSNDYVDISVDDTGKTLENTSTSSTRYVYAVPIDKTLNTNRYYLPSFAIELDLIESSGNCYLYIGSIVNGETVSFWYSFNNLTSYNEPHLKYVITPTNQDLYLNDIINPIYSIDYQMDTCNIRFTMGTNSSLKFKNLKIYPI